MELAKGYESIVAENAEVLAVSTDDLTQVGYAVEEFGTPFPMLSNPAGDVPRAYGVFNHFGDGLATGSVFVIDPQGNVRWSRIYTHIYDHVPTVEIVEQLKRIPSA